TRNYRVPEEDLESALADPETEVFELSKLGMNIYSNMRSYLELSTENFKLDHLNDDQRRLIHRVYGKDNFDGIMSIDEIITRRFGKRWIRTRTYVLNPDYVREHASAGAIGRASWLGNGNFDAVDFNINIRFRLRGVVSSERSES
ncbi:MAG: hypothetical protein Q8Q01_03425, partial [archaeon]|nr:hypothetical protein [archaeon]